MLQLRVGWALSPTGMISQVPSIVYIVNIGIGLLHEIWYVDSHKNY